LADSPEHAESARSNADRYDGLEVGIKTVKIFSAGTRFALATGQRIAAYTALEEGWIYAPLVPA
jgi:hypothetical protein